MLPKPAPPQFTVDSLRAVALAGADMPRLQRFFEDNPEYFLAVGDAGPAPDEAMREWRSQPPPEMPFESRWMFGFFDHDDQLVAMANGLGGFLAGDVWHIGLFIVASALHGRGTAASIYAGLERWMVAQGAQWIRLGVVKGHVKPERFWHKVGFVQVRERIGTATATRTHTLRVMVKPLAADDLRDYLARVRRDNPGQP